MGGCSATAERRDGAGAADRDELRGERARGGRGETVTAQASGGCHDPRRGDVGVPQARHQVGGRGLMCVVAVQEVNEWRSSGFGRAGRPVFCLLTPFLPGIPGSRRPL